MIVYGDPQYTAKITDLIPSLIRYGDYAADSITAARDFLIAAGQFEQAVCDGHIDAVVYETLNEDAEAQAQKEKLEYSFRTTSIKTAQSLTNNAAEIYLAKLSATNPPKNLTKQILSKLAATIDTARIVTVKIPEGFAFYSLFPEQYLTATTKWIADHQSERRIHVLVVGVRSIGTSLSAIVSFALNSSGIRANRITVRPEGSPYDRRVNIDQRHIRGATHALVVDEGPGASGSSMAAVAEALRKAGIAISNIAFVPGHCGEPGLAASESVRAVWSSTKRYTSSLDAFDSLRESAASLLGTTQQIEIHDLSGGLWRKWCYKSPAHWPAVWPAFERMKFLCRPSSGDGGSILWKFVGLGPATGFSESLMQTRFDRMNRMAKSGLAIEPLTTCNGFIGMYWIPGTRLAPKDFSNAIASTLAAYIMYSVQPPLTDEDAAEATKRLRYMTRVNIEKAFGSVVALKVDAMMNAIKLKDTIGTYGDGRMAPHEWVRTHDGKLLKSDTTGHECDHTIVGQQSLAWDIASIAVEWRLDAASTNVMINALQSRGVNVESETFLFYRVAYAAFRMGQSLFACEAGLQPEEVQRLQQAALNYKADLLATLKDMADTR